MAAGPKKGVKSSGFLRKLLPNTTAEPTEEASRPFDAAEKRLEGGGPTVLLKQTMPSVPRTLIGGKERATNDDRTTVTQKRKAENGFRSSLCFFEENPSSRERTFSQTTISGNNSVVDRRGRTPKIAKGLLDYYFEDKREANQQQRRVPLRFASISQYREHSLGVLHEEIAAMLSQFRDETLSKAAALLERFTSSSTASPTAREATDLRSVKVFGPCETTPRRLEPYSKPKNYKEYLREKNKDDDDKYDSSEFHLVVSGPGQGSSTTKNTDMMKDDLWLLSSSPKALLSRNWKELGNETFVVAQALWHGFSSQKMLRLRVIAAAGPSWKPTARNKGFWAANGPCACVELLSLQVLQAVSQRETPLLPVICGGRVAATKPLSSPLTPSLSPEGGGTGSTAIRAVCDAVCEEFCVNDGQRRTLQEIAGWFYDPKTQPITLVHGVFGSGKSTLLIAALVMLKRLKDELGLRAARALVVTTTNVAVGECSIGCGTI